MRRAAAASRVPAEPAALCGVPGMTRPVQHIAVVGRDAPLWMAALALERAFGPAGVCVTAFELPTFLQPTDAYAMVPSMESFHALLGFDAAILTGMCDAVPLVGQRFSNWSRGRHAFVHGYDAPPPEGDLFTQAWLKGRVLGLDVAYEDFSLAAAAAKQGRVPLPETATDDLAAGAGYQVGAEAYAGLLKHYARRRGIDCRAGRIGDVEIADGRIAGIVWEGGERVEADLFLDASGAEEILIGQLPGAGWESWREWLPCDQMLNASAPRLEPLPAFAQLSAFRAGWVRLEPLQDRTAVTICFTGGYLADDMMDNLDVIAGVRVEGDAIVSTLDPGVRPRAWEGNCVALGAAAARLEPLYPVDLHLVHVGLQQLIGALMAAGGVPSGSDAYNAAFAAHAANLRDLQIAHYRLNRRVDDPFWDRVRALPAPPALEEKLASWSAAGDIIVQPHEALQADDWAAVFIGHGFIPEAVPAGADAFAEEELPARMQQRLRDVARLVNAMPSVEEFIAAARTRGEGRRDG